MKKFLAVFLCGIMLFSFVACNQKNEDYTSKLISVMTEKETATVQEIFSFEFDRAYIFRFDDGYTNGEGFAEKYNLDISIAQVEYGETDTVQRIVFVDKYGSFVYEFKCIIDEVVILEKGLVIYPDTIIERKSLPEEEPIKVSFTSSEKYIPTELPDDKKVFNTENVARITFYAYNGHGTGSEVPAKYMPQIINWLDSFEIERVVTEEHLPPGTNTRVVKIEYTDGSTRMSGMDVVGVDRLNYYIKGDAEPDCFAEIISKTDYK